MSLNNWKMIAETRGHIFRWRSRFRRRRVCLSSQLGKTRKNENVYKMSKNENARAKRAKIMFFIVKYANLWGFCCRRRRACLSSLIGSLRSTTRLQRRRHKIYILNWQKQKFCTPFTCFFQFRAFLSSSRQICDVKWPFLKFYREREHSGANLNILF